MAAPEDVRRVVADTVARHLETKLGDRGLLLGPDDLSKADALAAALGRRLLMAAVDEIYRDRREQGADVAIDFGSEAGEHRVGAALAFGAATARVLAPEHVCDRERIELLCAVFNLGIGLVDGICDQDPEVGGRFVKLIDERALLAAAEAPEARGWLRTRLSAQLAADAASAFTADVIEAFFEILHRAYPYDRWLSLRRGLGADLAAALEAERTSVDRSEGPVSREQLIECSRGTSVLPFQIIETLAVGARAPRGSSAGTLLGEAMWRIDDLVDLVADARSGALNGLLLAAGGESSEAALERLHGSVDLAGVAARAADDLAAGLRRAAGETHRELFLTFVQRYAAISSRS
jgi:hypothetical protein